MKIEELVLSIEQMMHLKELGLEVKDTALCWYDDCVNGTDTFFEEDLKECVLTLTLREILELLPKSIIVENPGWDSETIFLEIDWSESFISYDGEYLTHSCETHDLLNASYNMLCWVLENGYLKKGDWILGFLLKNATEYKWTNILNFSYVGCERRG